MCYNAHMSTTKRVEQDRKSYNQICPMATALDIIGDRWTILILRELLGGSARFQELKDGLPGIATNLLTERLRRLETDGLVRQIHVHNTVLYSLTKQGASVRPALEELARLGSRLERVAPAYHQRSVRAIAMALQSILVYLLDAMPSERVVVELDVDGEYVEIVLDQRPSATVRLATEHDSRAKTTKAGLIRVLNGQAVDQSIFEHVSGDEMATQQMIKVFNAATSL